MKVGTNASMQHFRAEPLLTSPRMEPMPTEFPVLFVGDEENKQFRDAAAWLVANGAQTAANVEAALELIRDGFEPAVTVLALPCPGDVSLRQIEALCRELPLSRIVGLLGSWMEGERRTGRPWHPASRAYWHQWIARYAPTWNDARMWSSPNTAGEEEKIVARSSENTRSRAIHCAIYSNQRDTAITLGEMCEHQGWTSGWMQHPGEATLARVDVVLFDAIRGNEKEIEALRVVKHVCKNAPVVVLVGFPRVQDREAWLDAGASAVVSKPYRVDDLVWEIGRAIETKEHTETKKHTV